MKQLREYEDGKRDGNGSGSMGKHVPGHEDELLNSQLELMGLARSPGTIEVAKGGSLAGPAGADETGAGGGRRRSARHYTYTSLKILAREPRYFPPLNFGVVESDLYRSGHPQSVNFPFLETLRLKTIIYVGDKTNNWEYYGWIKGQQERNQQIEFLHVPVSIEDGDEIVHQLETILAVITHRDNYPVLIHSNKGKHRVGVVVAIIRKLLQRWALAAVYDEYAQYAKQERGKGSHDLGEMEFVEFFNGHIRLPARVPDADSGEVPNFVVL